MGENTQRDWLDIQKTTNRIRQSLPLRIGRKNSEQTPDPGVLNVEAVIMVSHVMEWKHDIAIVGSGRWSVSRPAEQGEKGKLGAAQFVRNKWRESKWSLVAY